MLNGVVCFFEYSKTCLKRPLKKMTKIGFQDLLSLIAGQKYCRIRGAFFNTLDFIILTFSIKTFVLSFFKWPA